MWGLRQTKDYFTSEKVNDTKRDCISKKTIKQFLDRLTLAETWLLKYLLGDNYAVKAAAVNVEVNANRAKQEAETFFGDLYVIQNLKNDKISFKLYCLEKNQFIWAVDDLLNLNGYINLKCNNYSLLHVEDSVYTLKFPNKKENFFFRESLKKSLMFGFEKAKR